MKRAKRVEYMSLTIQGQRFEYREYVNNDTFCYLFDGRDATGKRKRIYAASVAELTEKIEHFLADDQMLLASMIPPSKALKDYVLFYMKISVGEMSASQYRKNLMLINNSLVGSSIDKDIDTITASELQDFFQSYLLTHSQDQLASIKLILEKAFALAAKQGISTPDPSLLKSEIQSFSISEYILTPEEMQTLEDYCLGEGATKFKKRIYPITFSLLSGIPLASVTSMTAEDFHLDVDEPYADYKLRPSMPVKHQMVLDEKCVEWLREMEQNGEISITSYINPTDFVFQSAHGGSNAYFHGYVTNNLRSIVGMLGIASNISQSSFKKALMVRMIYQQDKSFEQVAKCYAIRRKQSLQEVLDEYHNQQELLKYERSKF